MPGTDGREVCRRIRADPLDPQPRVLMLTARDSLDDRVAGTRRRRRRLPRQALRLPRAAGPGAVAAAARHERGVVGVRGRGGRARRRPPRRPPRGDRRLDLTAKEFALLRYFMTRPGEVLSQETLLEHVWDEHADPFTNTVRVTVGTLRRKLAIDDEEPADRDGDRAGLPVALAMTTSWTPQDGREPRTGELPVVRPGPPDNVGSTPASTPGASMRLAERLPAWMGSIRFRLTVVYSTVVFGLAALVVGGIYIGLAHAARQPDQVRRTGSCSTGAGRLRSPTTRPSSSSRGRTSGRWRRCGPTRSAPCWRSSS